MAEKEITRRGYLNKYRNYKDWFLSHDSEWIKNHMLTCKRCRTKFIPQSPNQVFCSEKCSKEKHNPAIYNGSWVKKIDASFLTPVKKKTK